MTFTMLRDIARLPSGPGEMRVMGERVLEMVHHAAHLFPAGHALAGITDRLQRIAARFDMPDLKTVHRAQQRPPTHGS